MESKQETKNENESISWIKETIHNRPLPEWFDDAKFGIFIHWGVYSVPAFADPNPAKKSTAAMVKNCAEWYLRKLQSPMKDQRLTRDHHFETYGEDFKYKDFGPMFKAEKWNPKEWAELFKNSGAKYVVLTSKHHDGWCNWPTKTAPKWNSGEIGPKRDIIQELKEAVESNNMEFGLYYSLFEWYNSLYLSDKGLNRKRKKNDISTKYVDQIMTPQLKELVIRYHPSIVWGDGDWEQETNYWKTQQFLEWLYNESPVKDKVIVNDRFGKDAKQRFGTVAVPSDRFMPTETLSYKWENCSTIGNSWGYNQLQSEEEGHFKSTSMILKTMIACVSRGGNFLLNIGPTKEGLICEPELNRLRQIGEWMKIHGEAIYGTQSCDDLQFGSDNAQVFTTRSKQDLNIIYLLLVFHEESNNTQNIQISYLRLCQSAIFRFLRIQIQI